MSPPRVLLVEDEPSIRRFVAMALEGSGVELVEASTLAEARRALLGGPFVLLLCDLMLPDGSGFELLQALAAPDAPDAPPRRVAFSAGLSAEARQRLQTLAVQEVLHKPVSVAALLDCVEAAVSAATRAEPQPPAAAEVLSVSEAVNTYFVGDDRLYGRFADQCRRQWPLDAASGESALRAGDLVALRRLAHSLKSVLSTLGLDPDAALAQCLETAAAEGRAEAVASLWPRLREQLLRRSAQREWAVPGAKPAP